MKSKSILILSCAFCLVFALGASAVSPGAADKNSETNRLEALQKQHDKLAELIAQLKSKLDQNDTSTVPVIDLGCAQDEVEKRETAIASAYSKLNACIADALKNRKDALDLAWKDENTQTRNKAIGKAWTDFKKAAKKCQSEYKNSAKTAWTEFKTGIKACKASNVEANYQSSDLLIGG